MIREVFCVFNMEKLFPLDGCRWFGGDIVADAVDVVDFVYDTNRNLVQNFVRDSCPVSGHKVGGGYTAQSEGVIIGSEVTHNADRTHVGQNCEVLMNRFVQSCFCDLITEDEISVTQNVQFFLGNFTDNTDCKTRTWEWLTVYQIVRQTELSAQCANFVFEQQAQRLDDLFEVNIVRQTAYVVVGFDDSCITGTGFYDVSIDGSLCEEVNFTDFLCFFFENTDKFLYFSHHQYCMKFSR